MEDIDGLWKRFSLNDREDNLFDLSSEVEPVKPTFAAKFYTRRIINVEAIARTFKPLWQTRRSFSIQDVGDNLALIEFEDAADMERVLLGELWSYDKYLIAFHRLSNDIAVENLPFNRVDFWVQIHNLPVLSMKRKVAIAMGGYIGEVLPSPTQEEEGSNGKFMRVRVRMDITKPLCRGRKIGLGSGAEGWVSFQYERLPNFCYWCGVPTHGDRDCEEWLRTPEDQRAKPLEYGTWLRAVGERSSRRVQVTVEGSSRRTAGTKWTSDPFPKARPPPPPATGPPDADFPYTDMEVTENLGSDQIPADFPEANPMSFADRLHAIDLEINHVPVNQGELYIAGKNQAVTVDLAKQHEPTTAHLSPTHPPNLARAPLGDISNSWTIPEKQGRPKTGSWKKKARAQAQVSTSSPIVLAEKRTNAEAFQAETVEARHLKTARLFQNELSTVEAAVQPRQNQ